MQAPYIWQVGPLAAWTGPCSGKGKWCASPVSREFAVGKSSMSVCLSRRRIEQAPPSQCRCVQLRLTCPGLAAVKRPCQLSFDLWGGKGFPALGGREPNAGHDASANAAHLNSLMYISLKNPALSWPSGSIVARASVPPLLRCDGFCVRCGESTAADTRRRRRGR